MNPGPGLAPGPGPAPGPGILPYYHANEKGALPQNCIAQTTHYQYNYQLRPPLFRYYQWKMNHNQTIAPFLIFQ